MKIPVPYYKSKSDTDCGPLVLKMVLEYFGEKYSFEEISKSERQVDSGLVWSAGIARASRDFGFRTKFISMTNFDHEYSDIDYYKKYSNDDAMIVLKEVG